MSESAWVAAAALIAALTPAASAIAWLVRRIIHRMDGLETRIRHLELLSPHAVTDGVLRNRR